MNRFLRASRDASLGLALGLLAPLVRPAPCAAAAPAPAVDRLITLDAEDAPLPSVLKILAEKGDDPGSCRASRFRSR